MKQIFRSKLWPAAAGAVTAAALLAAILVSCAKLPSKQYYMLNYMPQPMAQRTMPNPYACVVRLKEFSIEDAYNRTQIVYRLSPYELRYYNYRMWAVKPTRMVTDLVFKHLNTVGLVSGIVRRFDEGRKPDFEISGSIEALEEYDSEDLLFAHVALRINLTRLSDGGNIYSRHFDVRKKVFRREADFMIREMSQIMEYIITQAMTDIDARLAAEFGGTGLGVPQFIPQEQPDFISDTVTPAAGTEKESGIDVLEDDH
jgi:ABC-type uncharacterized transport system auxiliary subunit